MKKIILIIALLICLVTVSSQLQLTKKQSMWKVPDINQFSEIDEKDYIDFVENKLGNNASTTDLEWDSSRSMYKFRAIHTNGTLYKKTWWFTVDADATNEEIQETAEEWLNIWMVRAYRKTLTKESVGGLDFSKNAK